MSHEWRALTPCAMHAVSQHSVNPYLVAILSLPATMADYVDIIANQSDWFKRGIAGTGKWNFGGARHETWNCAIV